MLGINTYLMCHTLHPIWKLRIPYNLQKINCIKLCTAYSDRDGRLMSDLEVYSTIELKNLLAY